MARGDGNGKEGAPFGNTNPSHRAQLNKKINKEMHYERIKVTKQLNRIALISKQLLTGDVITTAGKRRMTSDDRARLVAAADISFRLLAKVLPDRVRSEQIIEDRRPDRESILAEARSLGLPEEWVFGERGTELGPSGTSH